MEPLLDVLERTIDGYLDRPLALFGHSFGALLALELAYRFAYRSMPPVHLFVSGRGAPQVHTGLFWRALNNLNATLWMIAPDYDLIGQLRAFFGRIRPGLMQRLGDALISADARRSWLLKITGVVEDLPQALANLTSPGGVPGLRAVDDGKLERRSLAAKTLSLACLLISLLIVMRTGYLGAFRLLFLGAFTLGLIYALWRRADSR